MSDAPPPNSSALDFTGWLNLGISRSALIKRAAVLDATLNTRLRRGLARRPKADSAE